MSSQTSIFIWKSWTHVGAVMLNSSEVLGVHIGGQLEVFEGVEGDVSVVHHSKDHRDVSALEGQQLDSSQVRHRAVETGTQQRGKQIMRHSPTCFIQT